MGHRGKVSMRYDYHEMVDYREQIVVPAELWGLGEWLFKQGILESPELIRYRIQTDPMAQQTIDYNYLRYILRGLIEEEADATTPTLAVPEVLVEVQEAGVEVDEDAVRE